MWNPVRILPDAITTTRLRSPSAVNALWTNIQPSRAGMPNEFANSSGAAPVPPSPPSTVMKSGVMPVSSIALQRARNSTRYPTHSLNPTGLPPERSRSRATNSSSPSSVENVECAGGEITVCHGVTPRIAAISSETFGPGSTPP